MSANIEETVLSFPYRVCGGAARSALEQFESRELRKHRTM